MCRLESLGLGVDGPLEYVPFFEPDEKWTASLDALGERFPYRPMSRERHLYILQDIKRLVAPAGIRVMWPVDRSPDWSIPHLTFLACRSVGLGKAFFWEVHSARWLRAESIWDWASVERLLRKITDDVDEVLELAQSDAVRAQALEALLQCCRSNVFGVPFFCIGRQQFWGQDRVDAFLGALGYGHRESASSNNNA
jgi:2-hydroxychromene-2-carboxylate isomerase